MIWITIFFSLVVLETVILWFQWDKLSTILEIGGLVGDISSEVFKNNKTFKKSVRIKNIIIRFILKFKNLLIIPIALILLIDGIVATIINIIIWLITLIF